MLDLPALFDQAQKSKLWVPPRPAIIRPAEVVKPIIPAGLIVSNGWLTQSAAGGATPTFVAVGAKAQAAGTLSIPYYAGHDSGHIGLIFVAGYNDVTFGAATGYTAETQVNHASGMRCRLYWRRLDGSESANVSITGATSNANIGVMLGFSGCVSTGTPYEDYGSVTGDVASSLVTSGATTTAGNNRLLVRAYSHEMGVGTSPPGSWTERFDDFETVISAITLAIDSLGVAASGTTSATSRNLGGGNGTSYACLDLALLPS